MDSAAFYCSVNCILTLLPSVSMCAKVKTDATQQCVVGDEFCPHRLTKIAKNFRWIFCQVKTTFALKCSNLFLLVEDPPAAAAASRNLAGSELEAGPTSRMFLRLFSGLSSGSEAA
jgi:hypothetical protein